MKYLKYLKYLLIHRWFVFIECCKANNPWLGIIHDISKFLPSEFIPYARYFYGDYPSIHDVHGDSRNRVKLYKEDIEEQFNYAWLLHQNRNKHHWQWWILNNDDGTTEALETETKYLIEMVCDWIGAGKSMSSGLAANEWFNANKGKMNLNANTFCRVDDFFNYRMDIKMLIK